MEYAIYFKTVWPGGKVRWVLYAITMNFETTDATIQAYSRRYGGFWQARKFRNAK